MRLPTSAARKVLAYSCQRLAARAVGSTELARAQDALPGKGEWLRPCYFL